MNRFCFVTIIFVLCCISGCVTAQLDDTTKTETTTEPITNSTDATTTGATTTDATTTGTTSIKSDGEAYPDALPPVDVNKADTHLTRSSMVLGLPNDNHLEKTSEKINTTDIIVAVLILWVILIILIRTRVIKKNQNSTTPTTLNK